MRSAELVDLIVKSGMKAAGQRYGVAGLIFTYRCSIACRHCLFACSAEKPDVAMMGGQCADALAMLHETNRVVHAAGGEAMIYWEQLAEGLALAHEEGNAPHFIETNCSFAVNEQIVRERLEFLASHGVLGLLASADPFHQEWVPPERFILVRRLAREIFGEERFWGPRESDEQIMDLPSVLQDEERLREYVNRREIVMVGRAFRELPQYREHFSPRDDRVPRMGHRGPRKDTSCLDEFRAETIWEFHIDPYGNIQTNCGMILGNVAETTPAEVLARGPENANEFTRIVCESGPLGLAELATREYGFVWPESISQDCELCFLARRHLRQFHPDVFGPAEVYE